MFQSSMDSIWKWMVERFHPFESCEWPFLRNHRNHVHDPSFKVPRLPRFKTYQMVVTPRCEPEPSEVHLPNPELAGYYVGEFPYKWPEICRKMDGKVGEILWNIIVWQNTWLLMDFTKNTTSLMENLENTGPVDVLKWTTATIGHVLCLNGISLAASQIWNDMSCIFQIC